MTRVERPILPSFITDSVGSCKSWHPLAGTPISQKPRASLASLNCHTGLFPFMSEEIEKESLADWKNVPAWQPRTMRQRPFRCVRERDFSFYARTLRDVKSCRRWKRCTNDVDNDWRSLARLRSKVFQSGGQTGSVEIVERSTAMQSEIQALRGWERARRAGAHQLHTIANKIVIPNVRDYSPGNSARRRNRKLGTGVLVRVRRLAKIGKPVHRKEWGMSPPTLMRITIHRKTTSTSRRSAPAPAVQRSIRRCA